MSVSIFTLRQWRRCVNHADSPEISKQCKAANSLQYTDKRSVSARAKREVHERCSQGMVKNIALASTRHELLLERMSCVEFSCSF